jgi:hypothetical protein
MKAIKTINTMKQLIGFFSMLLFLFSAGNLYSQQVAGVDPADIAANMSTESAVINTRPVTQLSYDVFYSAPVTFDRNTLLSYSIPMEMDVEVKLYDKDGIDLKVLVSEMQKPGSHVIDLTSAKLKDGIYFYQLTIGTYTEIKKINLLN